MYKLSIPVLAKRSRTKASMPARSSFSGGCKFGVNTCGFKIILLQYFFRKGFDSETAFSKIESLPGVRLLRPAPESAEPSVKKFSANQILFLFWRFFSIFSGKLRSGSIDLSITLSWVPLSLGSSSLTPSGQNAASRTSGGRAPTSKRSKAWPAVGEHSDLKRQTSLSFPRFRRL